MGGRSQAVNKQADELNLAIRLSIDIFGEDNVFRRWRGEKYEKRMNRAVFDILVYYFSVLQDRDLFIKNKKSIREAFNAHCEKNPRFLKSITSNTNNLIETSTRFVLWGKALRNLGIPVLVPPHLSGYFKKIRNT